MWGDEPRCIICQRARRWPAWLGTIRSTTNGLCLRNYPHGPTCGATNVSGGSTASRSLESRQRSLSRRSSWRHSERGWRPPTPLAGWRLLSPYSAPSSSRSGDRHRGVGRQRQVGCRAALEHHLRTERRNHRPVVSAQARPRGRAGVCPPPRQRDCAIARSRSSPPRRRRSAGPSRRARGAASIALRVSTSVTASWKLAATSATGMSRPAARSVLHPARHRGLQAGEGEVEPMPLQVASGGEPAREIDRDLAILRGAVDVRPAREGQPQHASHLVEGLPRRVIDGRTQRPHIVRDIRNEQQRRVPSRNQQRQNGSGNGPCSTMSTATWRRGGSRRRTAPRARAPRPWPRRPRP
jgi:hypothetical protein